MSLLVGIGWGGVLYRGSLYERMEGSSWGSMYGEVPGIMGNGLMGPPPLLWTDRYD